MVKANCRVRFTRSDVDFLFEHASKDALSRVGSRGDLTVAGIDQLLDDEQVFRQAYEARDFARFSPSFFFYVGTRKCLKEYDIDDRDLTDYVSSVLCNFLKTDDLFRASVAGERLMYLADMVEELQQATRYEDIFDHHAHIGNYTLFLAGIFPDYLEYLSTYKRRPITRAYYESMGQTHYKLASSHDVARKEQLDTILSTLARRFSTVRRALTRLSVDYLMFNRSEAQRRYLSILNDLDIC